MTPFVPTRADVHSARALLALRKLPNELVLDILDLAHYWIERQHEATKFIVLMDEDNSETFSAAYPYIGVPAFPIGADLGPEPSRIREIEFTIVSHDQGWGVQSTEGSFETCSWFEASILRQHTPPMFNTGFYSMHDRFNRNGTIQSNIYEATDAFLPGYLGMQLVPRPHSLQVEAQRLHCNEMTYVVHEDLREARAHQEYVNAKEGEHAWFLQGNEVGRSQSVFEGEMVRRYHVIWGSKTNPSWTGNEGTGFGKDFVDSLQMDDWICVWARAKRRAWANHIYGIRITLRYTI